MSGLGRTSVVFTAILLAASAVVFVASTANAVRPGEGVVAWASELQPGTETAGEGLREDPGIGLAAEALPGGTGLIGVGGGSGPRGGTLYPRASDREILEAVNQDVFMPNRRPPLERYQLPGRGPVALPQEEQDPRRQRGPEIRVVGSAVSEGMAVALIQIGDSIPLALSLGEEVEGYVLSAVDEETATLVGESETLTLPVVPPLISARAVSVGPQVGPRGANLDRESIQALQERVQQLLREQMMNARRQNPNRGGRGGGGRS
jgi:hypothetical protein